MYFSNTDSMETKCKYVCICIFVVKYLTLLKTIETNTKIQSMQSCTHIYILRMQRFLEKKLHNCNNLINVLIIAIAMILFGILYKSI